MRNRIRNHIENWFDCEYSVQCDREKIFKLRIHPKLFFI